MLFRPLTICLGIAAPAVALRIAGIHPPTLLAMVVFGGGVVSASFVLAWAAEAAEVDISGGLAIALLALIAVLPEYAVDLYFAYAAGGNSAYVAYAAANMTGSNRLLLGLGWSTVVLLALYAAGRRSNRPAAKTLQLHPGQRRELGFLAIAAVIAFVIPVTGQIHLLFGLLLLALFAAYLWRAAKSGHDEPELVGPAARIAALPTRRRRALVIGMFAAAAMVVLACAEPFANALVAGGATLGVDRFLLVQWLAPLASEAPEFIVAILFAVRGKGAAALGLLISAKVNQWTLLVGSLPIAYAAGGGGGAALVLDSRQTEEFLLTATQTLLGVAVLLSLRFPRWAAWTLLALFVVQFVIPGQQGRYVLSAVYAVLAVAALIRNRRHILAVRTDRPREPVRI